MQIKKTLLITGLVLAMAVLSGCTLSSNLNQNPDNQQPTEFGNPEPQGIIQGVYGSAKVLTGNCMPGPQEMVGSSLCKTEYLPDRKIFVYELTKNLDQTQLVTTTETDASGNYQFELPAATYSLFIEDEDGAKYCRQGDGYGNLCPVTVGQGQIIRYDIIIDLATH